MYTSELYRSRITVCLLYVETTWRPGCNDISFANAANLRFIRTYYPKGVVWNLFVLKNIDTKNHLKVF